MSVYLRSSPGVESHASMLSDAAEAMNATEMRQGLSYFSHPEHQGIIIAHIILMVLAWVFVLPISVMFSIARSHLTVWSQVVFVTLNGLGLFVGMIYNASTPDLYENNIHGKFGWILTAIVGFQALLATISAFSPSKARQVLPDFHIKSVRDYRDEGTYRLSHDSGQGTEPPSPGAKSPLVGSSGRTSLADTHDFEDLDLGRRHKSRGVTGIARFDRVLARFLAFDPYSKFLRGIRLFCDVMDRVILILGFFALCTGVVVYGGHFKGHEIFSGAAHFVKGGIFVWYGLLVLGRYMGSFADLGWSWNLRSDASMVGGRKAAAPTPEFAESALIFVYGSLNMFLEHLGSEDGTWSATDLEHVSISVLFAGGGLFGMMIESSRLRELVNSALAEVPQRKGYGAMQQGWQQGRPQHPVSLNPIPAIIIMLLGQMMSSHHQASMTSMMLHAQWGSLFAVGAIARGVTYLLMFLSPPTTHLPSRPPSELIVAFCFLSGGLLFMGSNSDFVAGMELHDLNAMFLFTVVMGLTSFLLAWETVVLAAKAWAVRREL